MPESYLLRGILIGLVFGVPAGAIGALTIQRSLSNGFVAGFVTGLGSSVADLLYACVGVFGITLVSDFLQAHQTLMGMVGGVLIMVFGLGIYGKRSELVVNSLNGRALPRFFSTAFAIAIANPATIMAFFIAFSSFGIGQKPTLNQSIQLLFGILMGTCCWWGFLSGAVSIFRSRITTALYKRLNQVLGGLMFLFGAVMVARVFYI